ncbi:ATP-binding protein [Streptomyces sp. NPDC091292]|uniref:ATP-binding protein n=1 Tax=Streptomyces sp. NPDC091292 TaxID=3365991 RepID=UPI0037FB1F54
MRRGDADGRSGSRLPLRKSLLGRFLAVSATAAACSVAATAWIAAQTTSGAIRQEQGQNLADDTHIYTTLLGYAATHPDWDDVGSTVEKLADRTGRRITVTTQNRRPLADSGAEATPSALPRRVSAVVDPLSVDTALSASGAELSDPPAGVSWAAGAFKSATPTVAPQPVASAPPASVPGSRGPAAPAETPDIRNSPTTPPSDAPGTPPADAPVTSTDRIDPRAVGPFKLPAAERKALGLVAKREAECLRGNGVAVDVVAAPNGRPRLRTADDSPRVSEAVQSLAYQCAVADADKPTRTEAKALTALTHLTNLCLARGNHEDIKLNLDLTWSTPGAAYEVRSEADGSAVASCVGTARREQLSTYVAAPALLFIADPGGATVPGFDLSPGYAAQIAGATALVLALTVGASVLAGRRLVRPLQALTGAAQRMKDGLDTQDTVPVAVAADNEIGRLAAAFNDMAEHRARLERQRKVMVSDVAHELRTPLSNIRGWLEASQDGIAEPDGPFVSSLLEEAVQLQHIIDDLQDLAEADAGALRLHPEPVRVDDLVGQVAAAHQAQADTAGVTLTVSVPPADDLPVLTADPVRLRQAIGNLLSNAVRHTPSGGEVTLRAVRDTGGDGEQDRTGVVVEVRDTGVGIPEADLPYVFDRFWRAEKSRSRRTGGSGLGLAIVRKLTEAHGGSVRVSSEVGVGSVFSLRLPADGTGTGGDVVGDADGSGERERSGADAMTTAI